MSSDRVTVSLPADMRQAVQRIAQQTGVPFSSLVADALSAWLRGRLVDVWLAEHEAEAGAFDESELQQLAAEAGVPYLPPSATRSVA